MGFVPERNTYRLTFADVEKYANLTVRMTGLDVGEILDSMTIDGQALDTAALEKAMESNDVAGAVAMFAEIRDTVTRTYETFARHLVSWNVETPDGEHVPETLDGVRSQDAAFIRDIMDAWRTGVTGVDRNLAQPSKNGAPSAALSIPMEPLSPNPPS
jgi:hypothetical protein